MLLFVLFVAILADEKKKTYEPIVEQLYFLGNDYRNDPEVFANQLKGEAEDFVRDQKS